MSDVTYNPRRTAWDPSWNGNKLGTTYKVSPDLQLAMSPIKRASTGKIPLGHWSDGLQGSIKVQCADVELLLLQNLCPWLSDSGGIATPAPMTPNVNFYSFAQPLLLHPHDLPGSQAEDVTFVKAVPVNFLKVDRDGEKDDLADVGFLIYADLSKLQASTPRLLYAYIGAVAPT